MTKEGRKAIALVTNGMDGVAGALDEVELGGRRWDGVKCAWGGSMMERKP